MGCLYNVVVSATDSYPSNPDSVQTVTSTWKLPTAATVNPTVAPTVAPTVEPTTAPTLNAIDEAANKEGSTLNFTNDTTNPWIVDSTTDSGRVSVKSNIAGKSSTSTSFSITLTLNAGDRFYFDWKVSSESSYDYLSFYINGSRAVRTSGSKSWATKYYVIPTTGTYTFTWIYAKDSSVNRYSDCAWVDNVYVLAASTSDYTAPVYEAIVPSTKVNEF